MPFAHVLVCRVDGLAGDAAALGGAVTTSLCGHWQHEGECRWPHHTASQPDGDAVLVTVRYDAAADDVALVRGRVVDALALGTLTGPAGEVTTWRLLGCS